MSPKLKYGAEASCKRILESKSKVLYGAEASCKRILESKSKVWCRDLVQENTAVQT